MKVSNAVIKLVLWTSKTLADGTHPIMLRVAFNGSAMLSSHFSCKSNQWDEKNECLKRTHSNATQINKLLQELKNKAISARLSFEESSTQYTAKMIIDAVKSNEKDLSANGLELNELADRLAEDRRHSFKRKAEVKQVVKNIEKHLDKKGVILTELTDKVIIEYIKKMKSDGTKDNSIITYANTIFTLYQFAVDSKLTKDFPIDAKNYLKKNFKKTYHHIALDDNSVNKIKFYWNELLMNGADMKNRHSKAFAATLFVVSFTFQGLAPVDCIKLKQSQFVPIEMNGRRFFKIETNRSKTKQFVKILVDRDVNELLLDTFLDGREYFLPVLDDMPKDATEEQISRRIDCTTRDCNVWLREICSDLEINKVTLYSARHTAATMLAKKNVSIGVIAGALGRSTNGIAAYINTLCTEEELMNVSDALW